MKWERGGGERRGREEREGSVSQKEKKNGAKGFCTKKKSNLTDSIGNLVVLIPKGILACALALAIQRVPRCTTLQQRFHSVCMPLLCSKHQRALSFLFFLEPNLCPFLEQLNNLEWWFLCSA